MCAKVGHLAKDCPQQRRGKPAESRGHQQKSQQQSGTTSGNGANHHVTSELSEVKGKVASLRKELQAAEMEEAMTEKSTTLHVLEPHGSADGPVLGPTLFVDVMLEGQPVKALVDTGSPITTVFVKCLLDTLEKLRTPGQSVEEWRKGVESRLQSPSLSVNNNGGGKVNVISQLSVRLAHEGQECQSTILVQKGASLDLLLGTDVLPKLGCSVVLPQDDGKMTDLLQGQVWDKSQCLSQSSRLRAEAPSFIPAVVRGMAVEVGHIN